ncbi:2-oxoacid:acceptor oxidoreductase family protein [candidate division KSB1 bacterium]
MAKITEICWHGRGGQGAKTAALLLAESAIDEGMYGQGFPEYGPERMGAPVKGFNRISDEPIRVHSQITDPDIVVVLDPTLMDVVDVTAGLKENGLIIVNTPALPGEIRERLKLKGRKVYTIDATQIALDTIGRPIPNTVMIGAILKATGILDLDFMIKNMQKKLSKKFNPKVVEGNVTAIKRASEEAKTE